ncbi:MAG: DUF4268 domain-containing protein [Dehalococcoidia bacterium]|nr:DUF4268 domain-containing protein [Dehalococcoidia bacterium]MSQ16296.1 DUF4268 domain-containing protein [Dehalococcoidia bacterium]
MAVQQLGKLVYLDPQKVWQNEANEFTPWLQQNLEQLSAVLGIDIQAAEVAVRVGNFVADLVGEEAGSSRLVIIEGQLGRSDHEHLGRLMTYAASKDGGVIIWVAPKIQPEHRRALEWLNQISRGDVSCYGVELEVVQNGDSARGANFKTVVAPKYESLNNDRDQRYRSFFQDLLEQLHARRAGVTNANRAGYQQHLGMPTGRAGSAFRLAFSDDARFRIELYSYSGSINGTGGPGAVGDGGKSVFSHIRTNEAAIVQALGTKLVRERPDSYGISRIVWQWDKPVSITNSPDKLGELKRWALNNYFRFHDVMAPYLRNLPTRAGLVGLPQLEGLEIEEANAEAR